MQAGGNAVYAAIAAAAVITMTEPCSNGLGADNFAIVWDPSSRELLGLNSSGTAPAAWSLDFSAASTARISRRNGRCEAGTQ